ncbi:MAG: hypothetical protein Solumvirus2_67 [Solumvirus sp.]|uniref:Uncharacterized protein n=1 Tax=Solumvirus sp. TaxID=2487773 RepID=A0A3G5AGM8_9VIRU|nr:MAG: hypothetical protein Solumvirus2_67 [Solumvirus sp.]
MSREYTPHNYRKQTVMESKVITYSMVKHNHQLNKYYLPLCPYGGKCKCVYNNECDGVGFHIYRSMNHEPCHYYHPNSNSCPWGIYCPSLIFDELKRLPFSTSVKCKLTHPLLKNVCKDGVACKKKLACQYWHHVPHRIAWIKEHEALKSKYHKNIRY